LLISLFEVSFSNDAVVIQAAMDDASNDYRVSGAGLLSASSADLSVTSKFKLLTIAVIVITVVVTPCTHGIGMHSVMKL